MKIPDTLCEVVDSRGGVRGPFKNLEQAADYGRQRWPHQVQGRDWHVRVISKAGAR
ncbi:hypothetical protein ABIE87_006504 [Bradyrhizobium diazoefficiens]|uniref:hypothetical protein n=1 Tax=Bradyrhizobium diazoefficiens TaxID=1355477 RepID=UPI0035137390